MRWNLEPSVKVGPIVLGVDFRSIGGLFSETPETFKRVPGDDVTIYAYDESGCHLGIDSSGCISSVTIFQPNELLVRSANVLGRSIVDVVSEIRLYGIDVKSVDAGAWMPLYGMSVTFVDVDGIVDGVEVTRATTNQGVT